MTYARAILTEPHAGFMNNVFYIYIIARKFPTVDFIRLVIFPLFPQLTFVALDAVVSPRLETTFSYRFYVDPLLEPSNFEMIGVVYYHDENNNNFTQIVYNTTVTIAEPESGFTLTRFF